VAMETVDLVLFGKIFQDNSFRELNLPQRFKISLSQGDHCDAGVQGSNQLRDLKFRRLV
jgi:hypothetical protein